MYRVEFYCPRSGRLYWQPLTETVWLFCTRPRLFATLEAASSAADALIFRYHSARVVDPAGTVAYQI